MAFNKKLVVAGLAVGTTAYMLYKASKKHQPSQPQPMATCNMNQTLPQQQSVRVGTGVNKPNLGWEALGDWKHIANLLATCVMDQHLYAFYAFPTICRIAQHIASSGTLEECAHSWQLPPYLAQDLVKLSLFDVMFLLDDSASMRSEGMRRRDALAGILKRTADAVGRFDVDGMEVVWMNSDGQHRIHNAEEAGRVTERCLYDGKATPMGASLEHKILEPLVLERARRGRLEKPALVIVITDGRPTGVSERGEKMVKVLREAKKRLRETRYGEDAVSFQIAAVGNDREAQEWLDSMDNDATVGDLIDVCSDIEVESKQVRKSIGVELTQELYCLKLLLGPIDTSYDASDENDTDSGWSASARRKRERREAEKRDKENRFRGMAEVFRRERDAALSGATPVASAGGVLAPQGVDAGLSGYSHQPWYAGSNEQGGYAQAGGYQQQYTPQSWYAPPASGYQAYGATQPDAPPPPPPYPSAHAQSYAARHTPESGGFAMPTPTHQPPYAARSDAPPPPFPFARASGF